VFGFSVVPNKAPTEPMGPNGQLICKDTEPIKPHAYNITGIKH